MNIIGAGLIVTEGTAPMPEGLGYPRIPLIHRGRRDISIIRH
jgi:hypothetical protein